MSSVSSLFTLVKGNAGFFKSQKQADFLLSAFQDGVYVTTQNFTFGEYDNKTRKNSASITWEFHANESGITRVFKETSKERILWWEFSGEEVQKAENKKITRERVLRLNALHSKWDKTIEEIDRKISDLIRDIARGDLKIEDITNYFMKMHDTKDSIEKRIQRKCEIVEGLVSR